MEWMLRILFIMSKKLFSQSITRHRICESMHLAPVVSPAE